GKGASDMFAKLNIHNWRQFEHVEIDFHPRLTVLTGANGSGKTTILHLLNRHWGWNLHFVSGPHPHRQGMKKYWAGFWGNGDGDEQSPPKPVQPMFPIGEITYQNGHKATLSIPGEVSEVFAINIHQMGNVKGVYVPSHRPPYIFQKVET